MDILLFHFSCFIFKMRNKIVLLFKNSKSCIEVGWKLTFQLQSLKEFLTVTIDLEMWS